jgi:hypothetical protein
MKISIYKKVIQSAVKHKIKTPIVSVGVAGIGKTQTVLDVAAEMGLPCSVLRIGSKQDVGDLLGSMYVQETDGTRISKYAPPAWYTTIKEGGILFLDEVNRCKPQLQDAIMQILDQKRLDEYVLGDNVIVLGAMNPATEEYDVNEFEAAVVDRFIAISVENDVEDILTYAISHGWDQSVVDLIAYGGHDIVVTGKTELPQKRFTPRGLRQLQDILPVIADVPEAANELVIGTIGPKGFEKWKHAETYKKVPSAEEYLKNRNKYPVNKFELYEQMILISRLIAYVKQHKIDTAEREALTQLCCEVSEPVLSVILRIASEDAKVCGSLDFTDKEFSKKAGEILKVLRK